MPATSGGSRATERLPAMPRIYLYPEARQFSRVSLRRPWRRCRRRCSGAIRHADTTCFGHGRLRYRPIGTRSRCTIPAQAWSLHEHEGRWSVSVRLGDRRWGLRLSGGPHMRYQSAYACVKSSRGRQRKGALTIYETAAPGTSHRGGSVAHGTRVMIKIAAWLPKGPAAEGGAILRVRTHPSALLFAEPDWHVDPAPLRGVLAADARRRASIITNLRLERGQPRRRKTGNRSRPERALATFPSATCRGVPHLCRPSRCLCSPARARAVVEYDDRTRSALPHFPWEQLRRRVAEKLDERHIQFLHVNAGTGVPEPAGFPDRDGKEDAA